LPFLCVRAGERTETFKQEGNLWTLELPRGFLAFAVEKDLSFDPGLMRHIPLVGEVLDRFKPDLIHITGPNDVGMLGAGLAYDREIPLAASWHTNVHEYLARRSATWIVNMLSPERVTRVEQTVEDWTMAVAAKFYSIAQVLYAPNPELCALLEKATGRTCYLMPRGVDTEIFNPAKRLREDGDDTQLLGFVGRLSVEKNITLLAQIHDELLQRGIRNFKFLIVGHGAEEQWMRERMPQAEFTGVLRGEALSEAYANMDLLVFPSHTDTFGNVVLEALASGVPAIVTPDGGPKTIVQDGVTGRIVKDEDFTEAVAGILEDGARHAEMREAARAYSMTASWDSVFEGVYEGYKSMPGLKRKMANA
jgi:phosphatidylinositol alpha 1,6-mannosyltransferase